MSAEVATLEFRAGDAVVMDATEWETRAAAVRDALVADELPTTGLTEIVSGFRFVDGSGRTWCYTGDAWYAWDGQQWAAGIPAGPLRLQPFTLELVPDPPAELPSAVQSAVTPVEPSESTRPAFASADPNAQRGVPPFRPSHHVPPSGMDARSRPNPAVPPGHRLDGGLDVMVVEWQPMGWARIVASNGWSGWVDGRLLVPLGATAPQPPPPTGPVGRS